MKNALGKFGEFVEEYQKARRPYPPEVFIFLKSLLKTKKPLILDLGCGTGISTRQLAKVGSVIGCDPDLRMLEAAKKTGNQKYEVGSADKIPFDDSIFDVVTAFAAFHWFDDRKSIAEIKRVLKPGGLIFIVNKTGIKSWGEGYRMAIIKSIGRQVAHFQEDSYQPRESLEKNGFSKIRVRIWKKTELFDVPNAVEYVQSVSIWNSVPHEFRYVATEGVRAYFEKLKRDTGKIERKLTVKVACGFK